MVKANRNLRPALQGKSRKPIPLSTQSPLQQVRGSTLRAFLSARVGQTWKSVRDEYEKKFSAKSGWERTGIGLALLATGTSLKQGHVRVHLPRVGVVPLEESKCEFYVHPELGTLLRNVHYVSREQKERQREARRAEELHSRMREVSAHEQAHRIGEIWYLVELNRHSLFPRERGMRGAREEVPQTVFDAVLGRMVDASDRFELERIYGRRGVYGVRKRELSYRELRELGLLSIART